MTARVLAVLLLAATAGAQQGQSQPKFSHITPVQGGIQLDVHFPRFAARRLVCAAIVAGSKAESTEAPCGDIPAKVSIIPPLGLEASSVYIGVSACTGSQRSGAPVTCWSAGRDAPYVSEDSPVGIAVKQNGAGAAVPSAPAPPPAAPSGGIGDGAPPLLRPNEAPAAGGQSAAPGSRWTAGSGEPAAPAVRPPKSVRVRGHDGRMYDREVPAKGSLAERDDRYRSALAADPQTREAYANWKNLNDDQRRDALQRVSDIQAESYGIAPSKVELIADGMPNRLAYYYHGDRKIRVNKNSLYYDSPASQISTISHESRHRWQHAIVDKIPNLPAEELALAEAFKANFAVYCSPGGRRDCDYGTYRRQIVERDAFEHGEAAALELRGAAR